MRKCLVLCLLAFLSFTSTAFAAPIKLHIGAAGDGDGWTGLFNQMQFFANTTTTQFGTGGVGSIPVVGDQFADKGNLNITSFTGLVGDSEGLGVAGSTGTAYSMTAEWADIQGTVTSSTFIGALNQTIQTTTYTAGQLYLYLDPDVEQSFGVTVDSGDDTGFGADGNTTLIGILDLVSGTGTNKFNVAGTFVEGSSVFTAVFSYIAADFWYDGALNDLKDYVIDFNYEIVADIDQNTDNAVIKPIYNGRELFSIGSDHDGSIEVRVVPEPSTVLLLGAGLLGLGFFARKRQS